MSKSNPAFPIPEPLREYAGQFKGRCVVCKMPAYINGISDGATIVYGAVCTRCGSYSIPFPLSVHSSLRTIEGSQIANISGYIRENRGVQIASESDIDFLLGLSTPSAAEKASKLLAALAKHHPTPGTVLHIKLSFIDNQVNHFLAITTQTFPSDPAADRAALELFPALSASWSHDEAELRFLLVDYLCRGMGFIEEAGYTDGGQTMRFKISTPTLSTYSHR